MKIGACYVEEVKGAIPAHALTKGGLRLKKGGTRRAGDVKSLLAAGLTSADIGITLNLTACATSDIDDVGPAAVRAALGNKARFEKPVDPYKRLFLEHRNDQTVIGLPGSARTPALNGADWVLERVMCGLKVTAGDIARMGVGGLSKESPTRPQQRDANPAQSTRPRVEVLLLAAGQSRRMGGPDKLLEDIDGEALLRRCAKAMLCSQAERVHVIVPPGDRERRRALQGLDISPVKAPDCHEGMAASLRAGVAALSADCDAAVIALADMPEVSGNHVDQLIAAFDQSQNREICRVVDADGNAGHPVLFGRRFFESLAGLTGDRGARDVVKTGADYLVNVPTQGHGVTVDLDTPEDWRAWRATR